jgi:hypothetical protein
MSASGLRGRIETLPVPRPNLEGVHRLAEVHGKAVAKRRALGRSAAMVFLTLLVAGPIALLSPLRDEGGTEQRQSATSLERVEGPGMTAELPAGWDGRIEYIAGGAPAFEGANFPLTGVPLIAHPTSAEQTIVAIVDWTATCPCPGFEPRSLPLSVERAAFEARSGLPDPIKGFRTFPESHDFVRFAFRIEQRYFTLLVEAGSRPISERSLSEVNAVLRSWSPTGSLQGSPAGEIDQICPEGGPWLDPDCPEAQWVLLIVRQAGFRLDGDTGSAFTIQGQGPLLNIWMSSRLEEPVSPSDLQAEGYEPWVRIQGTQVYAGGEAVTWISGDLNVWIRPWGESGRPSADDITALVEASLKDPFAYGKSSSSA